MATTTISPNMLMPLPIPGLDPGPDWATNLYNSLTIVDQHDHSNGSGVQITPSGININSDLSFNNANATDLRTARFQVQASAPVASSDKGCLYVVGVDLYYKDVSGNAIRITQSAAVAGTPGSISNLVSPASASYVSGSQTFVWQSAALTPANLDAGYVILRNNSASSKGLTLQPPAAMGSNFSLTLPSLPAASKIVRLDASGNMSASLDTDNTTLEISTNTLRIKDAGVGYTQLADNSVGSDKIRDLNLITSKYVDGSVTTAKIADAGVTTVKIADANVTQTKLATNAVNTTQIVDTAVTNAKLADGSVGTSKIADSNVTTAKIADSNVTTAKIAALAVDSTKLYTRTPSTTATQGLVARSASSGSWTYSGSSETSIPNASVTLVTKGGPVVVGLYCADSSQADTGSAQTFDIRIKRDGTTIARFKTPGFLPFMDFPSSGGPYTYTATVTIIGGSSPGTTICANVRLIAYELN